MARINDQRANILKERAILRYMMSPLFSSHRLAVETSSMVVTPFRIFFVRTRLTKV